MKRQTEENYGKPLINTKTFNWIFLTVFIVALFVGTSFIKSDPLKGYDSVEAFKLKSKPVNISDIYNEKVKKKENINVSGYVKEFNDKYLMIVPNAQKEELNGFYLLVQYNKDANKGTMEVGQKVDIWGICTGTYKKKHNQAQITAVDYEIIK